jgi:hypothetical protein
MSSVPDGCAANHPLFAITLTPLMGAPLPGAWVRTVWIGSPAGSKKPEAYSLEYVEDFPGRERHSCLQIVYAGEWPYSDRLLDYQPHRFITCACIALP